MLVCDWPRPFLLLCLLWAKKKDETFVALRERNGGTQDAGVLAVLHWIRPACVRGRAVWCTKKKTLRYCSRYIQQRRKVDDSVQSLVTIVLVFISKDHPSTLALDSKKIDWLSYTVVLTACFFFFFFHRGRLLFFCRYSVFFFVKLWCPERTTEERVRSVYHIHMLLSCLLGVFIWCTGGGGGGTYDLFFLFLLFLPVCFATRAVFRLLAGFFVLALFFILWKVRKSDEEVDIHTHACIDGWCLLTHHALCLVRGGGVSSMYSGVFFRGLFCFVVAVRKPPCLL